MRHIYAMKLRELVKNARPCEKCSFSMTFTSRNYVTSYRGGKWLLLCEVNATFFKIYVTLLQRKCGDYEIMQAPHILRGKREFMQ